MLQTESAEPAANPEADTAPPSANPTESHLAADIALLGVALIWGINMPIMKIGLMDLNVFVFNAVRLTISAVVLTTFALRERRNGIRPAREISRVRILIFGLVISGAYQLLFLLGLARTTSGNTALIMATIPLWTAVLARAFLGEQLHRLAWLGLMVALIGTSVVVLQNGNFSTSSEELLGNLLILTSALVWAGGTVYSRPLLKQITPMQLSASASVVALPIHFLCAAGHFGESIATLQSGQLWLILLYAGVLSSGLALPLWNFGVKQAGASHSAAIQNLVPLVAVLAAWAILGESMTAQQALGGTLILCGLMLMRMSRKGR